MSAETPFSHLDPTSADYLDPDAFDYDQRYAALREQWAAEAGVKRFAPSHAAQQLPREMPRPVAPDRPSPQPVNNTALADAILKAGEKRRGELLEAPAPGSTADLILQAGRRRRGEI